MNFRKLLNCIILTCWINLVQSQRLLQRQSFQGKIPGFNPRGTRTIFARGLDLPISGDEKLKGGVVFALPDNVPTPPKEAFMSLPLGDGKSITIPKGFYHTTDTEVEVDREFELPSAGNPFSFLKSLVGGSSRKKEKEGGIGGIYLPMPFGLNPLSFQVMQKNDNDVEESGGLGLKNVQKPVTERPLISRILSQTVPDFEPPKPRRITPQIVRFICFTRPFQVCRRAQLQYYQQNRQPNPPDVSRRISSTLIRSLLPKIEEGFKQLMTTEKPLLLPIGAYSKMISY